MSNINRSGKDSSLDHWTAMINMMEFNFSMHLNVFPSLMEIHASKLIDKQLDDRTLSVIFLTTDSDTIKMSLFSSIVTKQNKKDK